MPWVRERLVAFDASALWGLTLPGRVFRAGLGPWGSAPLPEGALTPSPLDRNIHDAAAVRDALTRVAESMRPGRRRVTLVLPDGVARLALLEVPADAQARDYARFRLGQALPYALGEAIVEVLPLGGRRCLAAAVRHRVVAEYEEAAAGAGLSPGRVDLAPLLALDILLSRAAAPSRIDVILGDAALCLAEVRLGALESLRNRRRDRGPDEASRLVDDLQRVEGAPLVRVVGSGAARLITGLRAAGIEAVPGWDRPGSALPTTELAFGGAAA